jgi:hypothetical protein
MGHRGTGGTISGSADCALGHLPPRQRDSLLRRAPAEFRTSGRFSGVGDTPHGLKPSGFSGLPPSYASRSLDLWPVPSGRLLGTLRSPDTSVLAVSRREGFPMHPCFRVDRRCPSFVVAVLRWGLPPPTGAQQVAKERIDDIINVLVCQVQGRVETPRKSPHHRH